jgi:hypothetical protein
MEAFILEKARKQDTDWAAIVYAKDPFYRGVHC